MIVTGPDSRAWVHLTGSPTAGRTDEQIAIEEAAQAIYGPHEEDHYNTLTGQVDDLRDRLHDHLEN